MKKYEEFVGGKTNILISLSQNGVSQSTALPWDSNADDLIRMFVKMLWVAEYPPSWFPEVLRDLAEDIEAEFNPREEQMQAELDYLHDQLSKLAPDETDGKAE